jgi:hypothetical protein
MLLWNSPGFAATAWDLVYAQEFDSSSRTQRRDVAADLSRRIGVLINQMPEQRPRELARLRNKEDNIAEANNRERSAFYESTAYQHRFLAQLLTKIVQDLHCAATEQSVSAEMACWSRVALRLSDEERIRFAVRRLQDARRLDKDKHLPVHAQDPDVWYVTYGRGILEHIVIPHLEAEATP